MTSKRQATEGRVYRCRRVVGLLPLAAVLASPAASGVELAAILANARVSPPARVGFLEQRHNPLFEGPLALTGYLEYPEPGVLRKVIEQPFREVFSIRAGEIEIESAGETQSLPGSARRALASVLGAIEALLSGNAAALESAFTVEITGTESDWSVELVPASRRVGRHLARLTVSGDATSLSRISIDFGDGEWHVTELRPEASSP